MSRETFEEACEGTPDFLRELADALHHVREGAGGTPSTHWEWELRRDPLRGVEQIIRDKAAVLDAILGDAV